MKYRKLTATGDYSFGNNAQDFITDAQAVAQAVQTRLHLLRGEWWETPEDGLPLFQSILGVSNTEKNKQTADLLIQQRILGTTGVTEINNYISVVDGVSRTFTISCDINTVYGLATVEVNL